MKKLKENGFIEFLVASVIVSIFFFFLLKKINQFDAQKINSKINVLEKKTDSLVVKIDSLNLKMDFMINKQYEIQDSIMKN
jgi:hypothetical protein